MAAGSSSFEPTWTSIGGASRNPWTDPNALAFLWVVDFPLFGWSDEEERWDPMHHLFTSARAEDLALLLLEQAQVGLRLNVGDALATVGRSSVGMNVGGNEQNGELIGAANPATRASQAPRRPRGRSFRRRSSRSVWLGLGS